MPLTVGTAGHIDHGKTWLVRALTGKDTDRLPEGSGADLDDSAMRRSRCPTDAGSR
jgi:translation elongation factor EF-Tu-like GTPase